MKLTIFILLVFIGFLILPSIANSEISYKGNMSSFLDGVNPVRKAKKKKKIKKSKKKKRKRPTVKKSEIDINSVLPKITIPQVYDWKPRLRFFISCYKGGKYAIYVTDPTKDFLIVPNRTLVSDVEVTKVKIEEKDIYMIVSAMRFALGKYFKFENMGYNSGYFIARFPNQEGDFDLNELSRDIVLALRQYDAYEVFPRAGCAAPRFAAP